MAPGRYAIVIEPGPVNYGAIKSDLQGWTSFPGTLATVPLPSEKPSTPMRRQSQSTSRPLSIRANRHRCQLETTSRHKERT